VNRFRFLPSAFLISILLGPAAATAAPPNVTYLYPAGAPQGAAVEVTAGGTFERWPVSAWVSGKGVEAKAGKDKGKLTLTVAADAAPGLYWLRLYDEQGASPLRPFVVGTLPEVNEQEPNDDPKKPQALASSATVVNGRLQQTGDVDGFALKLRKGQTLVAALEANRTLGSPMDGILQLLSADGFVLEQNNDERDLDPQIVFTAPAEGSYIVRVFAFPSVPTSAIRHAGAEDYVYRLTLTTGSFADHAFPLAVQRARPCPIELRGWNLTDAAKVVPLAAGESEQAVLAHPTVANTVRVRFEPHACVAEAEPNDRQRPQAVELPVTVSGRLEAAGDTDVYRWTARKGQRLVFQVEARSLGSPVDAVLRLTDASGKLLTQVDDPGGRRTTTRDPELAYTVPEDGIYHIEVRDLHGSGGFRFVYRLRAVLAEPDYELTVAADRFTLTPGKPLDIPVTVLRSNGFAGEVEVRVEGLPEGVTATPARSLASGPSAKTVTLQLSGNAVSFSGSVRLVGKAGPSDSEKAARFALPTFGDTTADLWLTVLPTPAGK
jgi:hypothetical protein